MRLFSWGTDKSSEEAVAGLQALTTPPAPVAIVQTPAAPAPADPEMERKAALFQLGHDIQAYQRSLPEIAQKYDLSGKLFEAVWSEAWAKGQSGQPSVDLSQNYSMANLSAGQEQFTERHNEQLARISPFIARAEARGVTVNPGHGHMDGASVNQMYELLLSTANDHRDAYKYGAQNLEREAAQARSDFEPQVRTAHAKEDSYLADYATRYAELRAQHLTIVREMDQHGLPLDKYSPSQRIVAHYQIEAKADQGSLERNASYLKQDMASDTFPNGVNSLANDMRERQVRLIETEIQTREHNEAYRQQERKLYASFRAPEAAATVSPVEPAVQPAAAAAIAASVSSQPAAAEAVAAAAPEKKPDFQIAFTPTPGNRDDVLRQAGQVLEQHLANGRREYFDQEMARELSQQLSRRSIDLSVNYEGRSQQDADRMHSIAIERLRPVIEAVRNAGVPVDTGTATYTDVIQREQNRSAPFFITEKSARETRHDFELLLHAANDRKDPRVGDLNFRYEILRDVHLTSLTELVQHDLQPQFNENSWTRSTYDLHEPWSASPAPLTMTAGELQSQFTRFTRQSQQVTLPGGLVSVEADMAAVDARNIARAYEKVAGKPPLDLEGRPLSRLENKVGVENSAYRAVFTPSEAAMVAAQRVSPQLLSSNPSSPGSRMNG